MTEPVSGTRSGTCATIVVALDQPDEQAAWRDWLERNRGSIDRLSENLGCGCCVDIYEVEAPAEVIATLPHGVRSGAG